MIKLEKTVKVSNRDEYNIIKKFIINYEYNNFSNEVKMEKDYLERLKIFHKPLVKNVESN